MNSAIPRMGGGFGGGRGGFGGGRGMRHRHWATGGAYAPAGVGGVPFAPFPVKPAHAGDSSYTEERELDYLKHELEYLQNDSEAIRKRISDLETATNDRADS